FFVGAILDQTLSSFFSRAPRADISPLSLHDALPICRCSAAEEAFGDCHRLRAQRRTRARAQQRRRARAQPRRAAENSRCDDRRRDRKSTRLNSSHVEISYAVFCLKKKKKM